MKAILFELLDWCGLHSELLIAIGGFASSVAIAKITSGLDLRKTLCLRRFEAYEKAIGHLALKLNVYNNILAAFETLNEPVLAVDELKCKVALLLTIFVRLGEIEKDDFNMAGVVLYAKLPTHDVRPLTRETARFIDLLQGLSFFANLPNSEERVKQFAPDFISGINRLKPLVEEEANHLNAIYNQLNDEIRKDKVIRKMFRMV